MTAWLLREWFKSGYTDHLDKGLPEDLNATPPEEWKDLHLKLRNSRRILPPNKDGSRQRPQAPTTEDEGGWVPSPIPTPKTTPTKTKLGKPRSVKLILPPKQSAKVTKTKTQCHVNTEDEEEEDTGVDDSDAPPPKKVAKGKAGRRVVMKGKACRQVQTDDENEDNMYSQPIQ